MDVCDVFLSMSLQVRAEVSKLEKGLGPYKEFTTLLRDTFQACSMHQVRDSLGALTVCTKSLKTNLKWAAKFFFFKFCLIMYVYVHFKINFYVIDLYLFYFSSLWDKWTNISIN